MDFRCEIVYGTAIDIGTGNGKRVDPEEWIAKYSPCSMIKNEAMQKVAEFIKNGLSLIFSYNNLQ